ncbi:MAG TPA: hypothetical protein ENK37_10565, partial [Oceanithermus profundus]|nr:hypothetical protein [Oceanithermus profundus]
RRAGIREVILPHQNEPDLRDIPRNLQRDMTFHFVENLDQALDLALVGGLHELEARAKRAKRARARRKKTQPAAQA